MAEKDSTKVPPRVKDEIGNVYGKLTVLEFAGMSLTKQGGAFWLCQCECGNMPTVSGANLRKGVSRSCGCNYAKDMEGKRFNRLMVIRRGGTTRGGEAKWLCRCDCGQLTTVAGSDLRKGDTKSCGCGRRSQGGGYKTTEYTTWKEMKRRCYNPNTRYYHLYGGREITICDRWRTSFVNFLADMGPKPFPEATIERIDNDGNYEPENCKWASKLEQGQNTRKVRLLTHNGKTLSIRGWARELGMRHCVILWRLKHKWPIEKVLSSQRFS